MNSSPILHKNKSDNLFRSRFKRLLADKFNNDILSKNSKLSKESAVPLQISSKWNSYIPKVETMMFDLTETDDGNVHVQPAEKRMKISEKSPPSQNDSTNRKPLSTIFTPNRFPTHRLPFFLRKQQFKAKNQSKTNSIPDPFVNQARVQKNQVQRLFGTPQSSQKRNIFQIINSLKTHKRNSDEITASFKFSTPESFNDFSKISKNSKTERKHDKFPFSATEIVRVFEEAEKKLRKLDVLDEITKPKDTSISVIDQMIKCPICRHLCDFRQKRCSLCNHEFKHKKSKIKFSFSTPISFDLPQNSISSSKKPTETFKFSNPSTDFGSNKKDVSSNDSKLKIKLKPLICDSESAEEFEHFKSGVLFKFRKLLNEKQARLKKKEERASKIVKKTESSPVKPVSNFEKAKSKSPNVSPAVKSNFFKPFESTTSKKPTFNPPSINPSSILSSTKPSTENLFSFKTSTEAPVTDNLITASIIKTGTEPEKSKSIFSVPAVMPSPFDPKTNEKNENKSDSFSFGGNSAKNIFGSTAALPTFGSSTALPTFRSATQSTKPSEPEKTSGFSFGNGNKDPSSFFKFDAKTSSTSNSTNSVSTSGFQFGNMNNSSTSNVFEKSSNQPSDPLPVSSAQNTPAFSAFAQTSSILPTAPQTTVPTNAFNFSAPAQTTSGINFNFGKTSTETKTESTGFVFGAKTNPSTGGFNFSADKPVDDSTTFTFQAKGQENKPFQTPNFMFPQTNPNSAKPTFGAAPSGSTAPTNNIFAPKDNSSGAGFSFALPQTNSLNFNFGSQTVNFSASKPESSNFSQQPSQINNPTQQPTMPTDRKVIRARRRHV